MMNTHISGFRRHYTLFVLFLISAVTLIVAGPWLVQTFMEYILQLYGSIPQLIG